MPEDSFNQRAPGYLYRQCKKCRLEVRNKKFESHPDSKIKDLERSKQWYQLNKEKVKERNKINRDVRKERDKWYRIKNTYSLTKEQYLSILESQNYGCAICEAKNKKFYVDHDHSCCPTEVSCGSCVRGLLCQKCNMFMHYVDEYLEHLDKAIKYGQRNL